MTTTIVLVIGALVCFISMFALFQRVTSFLIKIYFDEFINLRYIDKTGKEHVKRVRVAAGDELLGILDEIKAGKKTAKEAD